MVLSLSLSLIVKYNLVLCLHQEFWKFLLFFSDYLLIVLWTILILSIVKYCVPSLFCASHPLSRIILIHHISLSFFWFLLTIIKNLGSRLAFLYAGRMVLAESTARCSKTRLIGSGSSPTSLLILFLPLKQDSCWNPTFQLRSEFPAIQTPFRFLS